MELAEALVEPQPTLKEDSPATDLEKTQHYDGSAKAPEAHVPGNYRHNESVVVLGPPYSYMYYSLKGTV